MSDFNKQVVRSVSVTLCAQALKFFIGLGVTMILARLLTPKDYGLVGMVGVVTGFVAVFRDGGLSVATVQRAEITEDQLSTLFWINTALGFATASVVALLSPFVAWFYDNNELIWIVVALAFPFILNGLTAQPQALLQRQMQFKTIAYIEISSLIVSAIVGIMAAAAGWGSWALVIMSITLGIVNTILVFFFCRWRPTRPVRGCGVRSMLKFGGALTASKFFDSLACSTDILLLGKLFSSEMVGLYTRAQTLMLQPLTQLMPPLLSVALPAMSRLAEGQEKLKDVFLDMLQMTALISSFITIFIVVGADWVISVFLGSQWLVAADILQLLAGPALFIPVSVLCVLYLTAQGNGGALVRWGLLKNIITVLSILAGVQWGAKGVAGALSVASVCILLPILMSITAKSGPANLKELWRAAGIGLGACAFGGMILSFVLRNLEIETPLIGLLVLFLINSFFHSLIIGSVPSCRRTFARTLSVILSSRAS